MAGDYDLADPVTLSYRLRNPGAFGSMRHSTLIAAAEEIERLRAALADIAEHGDVNADECPGIARRALSRE